MHKRSVADIILNIISIVSQIWLYLFIYLFFTQVFLDNIMETVNGPETAKKMREIGYTGPIIGVTGNVLKDDIRNFLKKGNNDLSIDNEYSLFTPK